MFTPKLTPVENCTTPVFSTTCLPEIQKDWYLRHIGFGFILDRHHKFISLRDLTYVPLSFYINIYIHTHIDIYTYT